MTSPHVNISNYIRRVSSFFIIAYCCLLRKINQLTIKWQSKITEQTSTVKTHNTWRHLIINTKIWSLFSLDFYAMMLKVAYKYLDMKEQALCGWVASGWGSSEVIGRWRERWVLFDTANCRVLETLFALRWWVICVVWRVICAMWRVIGAAAQRLFVRSLSRSQNEQNSRWKKGRVACIAI